MLKIFIDVMYFLGLLLTGIGLIPVLSIPPVIFVVAAAIFVITLLVYSFKCAANPAMPSEATPDECWTLGSVY